MVLTLKNINKENISILLRDLSQDINDNIKYTILDYNKVNHTDKQKLKKKDIIIKNQIEKMNKINLKEDEKLLKNFIEKKYNYDDIFFYYNYLKNFKTDTIKEKYKLYVLELLYNKPNKNIEHIMGLYFQLNYIKNNSLIEKLNKKVEEYDYNLYILKNLGHILPPLNYWDQKFKLEDWQIKAIDNIKNKKSMIIKAPTASGKSYISLSAGIFHQNVLYVCPSNALAYQIGSYFYKMNYKIHFLLEDLCEINYDKNCKIFIGTPKYIETYIHKLNINFEYVVYDEINIFTLEYENLLKLLNCNFVALSATISNIDKLKTYINKLNGKNIEIIEYNKRFINIQNWIVNADNKLEKIHPISPYNIEELEQITLKNIKCTPYDISLLYELLEEELENLDENTIQDINDKNNIDIEDIVENISPDNYFNNNKNILSLDKVYKYEKHLLNEFYNLSKIYKPLIENILIKLKKNSYNTTNDTINKNIKYILDDCKKTKKLPMIIFNNSDECCETIFYNLYNTLKQEEELNYPYHYYILEKKQELYKQYIEKRDNLKNNISLNKTDNIYSIENKLNNFDKKSYDNFTSNVINLYESLFIKIENSDKESNIKKLQIKNLKKEVKIFIKNPDFCYQDIYVKHLNYCYNLKETMSGEEIKSVRRKIMKILNITIQYEHPIFQMLKRGIGLYINTMPSIYLDLLQTLLSNKNIGIIISGKELSLGLDLPVVSTMLLGYNNSIFNKDEYYQMSGRAGRRGKESTGNVIFYNIDFNLLMKQNLPEIKGSDKFLYNHYSVLNNLKNINTDNIFNHKFNDNLQIVDTFDINKFKLTNINGKFLNLLVWNLRYYKNYDKLINYIDDLNNILFNIQNIHFKYINLLENIQIFLNIEVISDFKLNKYNINYNNILEILLIIYNNVNNKTYEEPLKVIYKLYDKLKNIIYKNNKLYD